MYSILIPIFFFLFPCCTKKENPAPPSPPRISVQNLNRTEGNTNNVIQVTIQLDKSPEQTVSLQYISSDGTAKNGDDYTPVSGTLEIQPGATSVQIPITIIGDDIKEAHEQFRLLFSNAQNATLQNAYVTVTIENDDTKVGFNNAGYDAPTSYPGYTLVWSDEFNTGTLDASAWTNENGDGCPNLCGWGNNELEYYTDRPENIFFQDGKLIIEARKEAYGSKEYTSSKILTRGKKTFRYGRVDIRAILPKGQGIWPAFWMLPQDNIYGGWPTSGEIDIMELVGHEPNRTHGTLHFGPGPGSTQINRSYTLSSGTFNDEFHVFSIEWKENQIKWYVDGNLFSTANSTDVGSATWPFNEEFFFIFNLAVGGNWPGNPDGNTYFPQWLIVDYIRVYQE